MDSSLYYFGLICLIAILAAMALPVLFRRSTILEFPVLTGLLGIAWVIPQAIGVETLRVNDYATPGFWLYVAGCYLFIWVGFHYGRTAFARVAQRRGASAIAEYDYRKLTIACAMLAVVATISTVYLGARAEELARAAWTGEAAAAAMLSKTGNLALCLATLIYLRTRSKAALIIAIIVAIPMIQTALSGVRRELLLHLFLLTVGVYAMVRHRYPTRAMVLAAVVAGTIIVNSAGNLRSYVANNEGTLLDAMTTSETYTEFSFLERDASQATEIRQAQYDHWRVDQLGTYQFGAGYWNGIVQLYVPAFIVGRDVKEAIKIRNEFFVMTGTGRDEAIFSGSTRTGFGDSYLNFGTFGLLVFALIGFIFGYAYSNAMAGGLGARFIYFAILTDGLKAVTHSTAEFFAAIIFVAFAVWLTLKFAHRPARRHDRVPRPGGPPIRRPAVMRSR